MKQRDDQVDDLRRVLRSAAGALRSVQGGVGSVASALSEIEDCIDRRPPA